MASNLWRKVLRASRAPGDAASLAYGGARRMGTAGPSAVRTPPLAPVSMTAPNSRAEGDVPARSACHLVKIQHLHPSTKEPPSVPRAGDIKTGRVRPDAVYVPLSKHVFGIEPRRDILHAAVVYYLDGRRSGLKHTLARGEVSYGGAKIRQQKGSGSARLGRRNNPLLRGGGVIHAPKPRDMSTKLNRRVRELALRSALSARLVRNRLAVVKDLAFVPPPNTGLLRQLLKSKGWADVVILSAPRHPQPATSSTTKIYKKPSAVDPVYTAEQESEHASSIRNLVMASSNMKGVEVINLAALRHAGVDDFGNDILPDRPSELHAYHVLMRENVVLDLGAVEWLEEKFGGAIFHSRDEIDELSTHMRNLVTDRNESWEAAIPLRKKDKVFEEAERVRNLF